MSRARDVADVQDNLGGAVAPFVAGKNKVINGDFGVWQRGTSFAYTGSAAVAYSADRLYHYSNGNGSWTFSQQALAPASISGYDSAFFARASLPTAGTTTALNWGQRIEDVRTNAGQIVTISFWAKSDVARTINWALEQNFGSGGSATVTTSGGSFATTTAWARYTTTLTVPSISGKTVGTSSYLGLYINTSNITNGFALDIWGFQLEAGSVATAFTTATGTIQGELAACQRYYWRATAVDNYAFIPGTGLAKSTTAAEITAPNPVAMRVAPYSVEYSNVNVSDGVTLASGGTITLSGATPIAAHFVITYVSGLTQFRTYFMQGAIAPSYLAFGAEL